MEMRLPTSLDGWYRLYWGNRPVCLIAAIETEGKVIDIPTLLKCTKGHGNRCSHVLPDVSLANAKEITGNYVVKGKEPHVNDGVYEYSYSMSSGSTSGSQNSDHYKVEPERVERYVHTIRWSMNPVTKLISWTWTCTKTVVRIVEKLPNRRVAVLNERYQYNNGGEGYPPHLGHYVEKEGQLISSSRSTYGLNTVNVRWDLKTLPAKRFFRFGEYDVLWNDRDWSQQIRDAMTLAFQDAFGQVPTYADNNIANMVEMGEFVMDALKPDGWSKFIAKYAGKLAGVKTSARKAAKALGSLWLAYRYAYQTTKSDTRQAIDTASRRAVTYLKPLKFNGTYSWHDAYLHCDVELRCEFSIVLNASNMLGMLHHYAQLRGVNLSGYKVWDLIPFSFIADWFVDIGGMLKDQEMLHSYADYIFGDFWWSIKYKTTDVEPYNSKVYSRWSEYYVPTSVIRSYNSASTGTWLKRAGDTVALTTSLL
jgi:hypothetical protein